jgi:hypothetical protein
MTDMTLPWISEKPSKDKKNTKKLHYTQYSTMTLGIYNHIIDSSRSEYSPLITSISTDRKSSRHELFMDILSILIRVGKGTS